MSPRTHFRCNPFFVRCIKPNNMKVQFQTASLYMHAWPKLALSFSVCPTAVRNRVCLMTTSSATNWNTQGSWRPSGFADRGILSECPSVCSCSGTGRSQGNYVFYKQVKLVLMISIITFIVWPLGFNPLVQIWVCVLFTSAVAVILRYKSLVGMSELPAANGENCVAMLSKLCPLGPGEFHVGVTKVKF